MISSILIKTKRKEGFTLIELLVVIAIIGTLSTIGFIALTSSQDGANDAVKVSEVRSLQSAIQIWSATSGSAKFPITAVKGECEYLDKATTGLQHIIGDEITGIDWTDDNYFYCAGDQSTQAETWYVVGASSISNSSNSVLSNDIDGNAGGKITKNAAGTASTTTIPCGLAATDTAYCVGVI